MIVGLLTFQLHLQGVDSLKAKRSIVKSLIGRLQSRFNASVAETDLQDSKQLAMVGVSIISNDGGHLDEQLDKLVNFVVQDGRFYVGRVHRETFSSNVEPPRW